MFIHFVKRNFISLFFFLVIVNTKSFGQEKIDSISELGVPIVAKSPSGWLQATENTLMDIESRLMSGQDTSFMKDDFERLEKDYLLAKNDYDVHGPYMRIRSLDDLIAKLTQQRDKISVWRKKIYKINAEITAQFFQLEKIKSDSIQVLMKSDTAIWTIYGNEIRSISEWVNRIDTQYYASLKKFVGIEHRVNELNYKILELLRNAEQELRKRGNALFTKTHPALWELSETSYKEGIGTVIVATFKQSIDSLAFYGKNAYIRAILFRLFLLLITMLPVLYFRKLKKMGDVSDSNQKFTFVHKYTGAASASFGMVMAPFIFINAPHIFIETILATLAVTTTVIFLKENPKINRKWFYAILIAYIILHVFNLMTSVTLFGRILWSFTILLVIPFIRMFRQIGQSDYKRKLLLSIIVGLTILLIVIGWAGSISGHFPLGRILVMAGLDGFFLFIILFVAIYSFIDFIAILGDLYNRKDSGSKIRLDRVFEKLLPLVTYLAIAFWFAALLSNINALKFVVNRIAGFINQPATIGGYTFNFGSALIFILVLYLAFYISSFLTGLFIDDERSDENTSKSRLGSYMLLLRLFIISSGFVVAMLASGIPLNNVSLIIGAFGVGIGFGLQHIIGNLVSGVIIAFEKPIFVGDIVEIDGIKGRVTDIGIRATTIDSTDGAEYIVPNGDLISKVMKNWTLNSKLFRIELNISLGLDNDIGLVTETLNRVLVNSANVLDNPLPKATLKDIKTNALDFQVSCWVRDIAISATVRNEILSNIHKALREAGVVYPQNFKPES